jgi:hypothetical protein
VERQAHHAAFVTQTSRSSRHISNAWRGVNT